MQTIDEFIAEYKNEKDLCARAEYDRTLSTLIRVRAVGKYSAFARTAMPKLVKLVEAYQEQSDACTRFIMEKEFARILNGDDDGTE